MTRRQAGFIYTDTFQNYNFGEQHPFNQKRVELTYELLKDMKAISDDQIITPRIATDSEIALVHDPKYIDAVKRAGRNELKEEETIEFGIGTEDTPAFQDMHLAASQLVGGTLSAVDHVLNGSYNTVVNLGGGLHHGFRRKASGFCIYNDAAIAIQYIRKHYDYNVLYVDTDAHHGDGVQWIFYDDPNVCTLSIHETGRYLFPGTGNINERGHNDGYGTSFNVPIDAFTEDESFLDAYQKTLFNVAEHFNPDIIVTQNGADAHVLDPLSHLACTMKIYEEIPKLAQSVADTYCQGKWVALGGGGYDIWRVVPRAWSQLWAVASQGEPFEGDIPASWLERFQSESPVTLPTTWHDKDDIYKPIPRKEEITEKNSILVQKLLQPILNDRNYMM
ncbi:acetoin utilization protein AcuC [Alkalibacillus almallahensis]|uniref:acetoin utilization protein AcuC n=1 Tax=Alkalibacillus almallahensis TaxID=1379154 RepID=UPI001422ED14|nr:acetoin utilization protein AcuC [Alkalibacillus almallahensis]NIK11043.1 acetoin utilization protein AcuC [Alkalibacillus almallahensis]